METQYFPNRHPKVSRLVAARSADRAALDAALIAAHETRDHARLVSLYCEAADRAEAAGATDVCCFFLTQAYVFALVAGAPEAGALHARLAAHGREE